ncbi:Hypothetical predicted protein, partial [Pelobates cultripes]
KVQTEEQLGEWNTILLDCSFRLMDYLIKLETTNFDETNSKLQNEITKIKNFKSDNLYVPMENKLQQNITNYRQHLKIKKHNKFQRDFKDFNSGEIFRQKRKYNRRPNSYRGSSSGETDWSDQDQPRRPRRNNKSSDRKRDPSVPPYQNKSILRGTAKSVSFLDIPISLETINPTTPSTTSSATFLEQDSPRQQRGRLRDRERWAYKIQNRTQRT